jgi:hypothetical protein
MNNLDNKLIFKKYSIIQENNKFNSLNKVLKSFYVGSFIMSEISRNPGLYHLDNLDFNHIMDILSDWGHGGTDSTTKVLRGEVVLPIFDSEGNITNKNEVRDSFLRQIEKPNGGIILEIILKDNAFSITKLVLVITNNMNATRNIVYNLIDDIREDQRYNYRRMRDLKDNVNYNIMESKYVKGLKQILDKPDYLYFNELYFKLDYFISDKGIKNTDIDTSEFGIQSFDEDELAGVIFGSMSVIDYGEIANIGLPYNDDGTLIEDISHRIYDEVLRLLKNKPYIEKITYYGDGGKEFYYSIIGKEKRDVELRTNEIERRVRSNPKLDPTDDSLF